MKQKLKNLKNKLFLAAESLHTRLVGRKILVLGDSHAAVFRHVYWRLALFAWPLRTVSVGGATASGAENPNSTTRSSERYEAALLLRDYSGILVTLGEVDTGFLIWQRAKSKGISVEESYRKTIDQYFSFLAKLKGYAPVCVVSTPLPTIGDEVEKSWGEIANLRKEIEASQLERTDLTLRFNRDVALFCEGSGIGHISLDQQSLGADGLVRGELLNRDSRDHHYQDLPYCRMLRRPIAEWAKTLPRG